MIKQLVSLIILSAIIIVAMLYAQLGIQYLLRAHDYIAQLLGYLFAGSPAGTIAKKLLALLSLPILIAAIPAFIYWLVRRKLFPYFMPIVWTIWLVQVGALLMVNPVIG